jgi:hypothetical protein
MRVPCQPTTCGNCAHFPLHWRDAVRARSRLADRSGLTEIDGATPCCSWQAAARPVRRQASSDASRVPGSPHGACEGRTRASRSGGKPIRTVFRPFRPIPGAPLRALGTGRPHQSRTRLSQWDRTGPHMVRRVYPRGHRIGLIRGRRRLRARFTHRGHLWRVTGAQLSGIQRDPRGVPAAKATQARRW